MKRSLAIILLTLLSQFYANASKQTAYVMPRTQVIPIKDSKADRQYELFIRLPDGYSENISTKYPVIYSTDAAWHMETLAGVTEYLMPNVIIVGISWQTDLKDEVANASRFRDYTLIKSTDPTNPEGEAANHLSFIRNNVIKYVEDNYRTDPNERTYLGYSLGGLFGAYILFSKPDTFKHYILGSPYFNEQRVQYIDDIEVQMRPLQKDFNTNIFISIGEQETPRLSLTQDYLSILQRRRKLGLSITGLEIIRGTNHATAFPETTIRAVKWLAQKIDK